MIRLPEIDFVLRLAVIDGMGETKKTKSGFSADWLIGGVLGKFGEILDRITGRGWNPSSSLAASKLTEKLKFLLDEESKRHNGGRFVPHIITLKIQWNKFSSDAEDEIDKLENELHAAAIDHINDRLYHTFAPIKIDIKTDYFTEGVRLIGSFGEFGDEDDEAAINVTVPNITIDQLSEGTRASIHLDELPEVVSAVPTFTVSYRVNSKDYSYKLIHAEQKRYTVGRAKDNDITINDQSVSKVHASLVIKDDGRLLVADTGSTNGTFVSDDRIAYGKAIEVTPETSLKFGTVKIGIERSEVPMPAEVIEPPQRVEQISQEVDATSAEPQAQAIPPANTAAPPRVAEPTVSFSDVESLKSEEAQPLSSNSEKHSSDDWAMTEQSVETPKPSSDMTPRNTSGNEVAAQPPAETVASINTDSVSPDTSDDNWSDFESQSTPAPKSTVASGKGSEDWDSFSARPKQSSDSGENIGTNSVADSKGHTDEWADFAKSEADSKEESKQNLNVDENQSKEDWEI